MINKSLLAALYAMLCVMAATAQNSTTIFTTEAPETNTIVPTTTTIGTTSSIPTPVTISTIFSSTDAPTTTTEIATTTALKSSTATTSTIPSTTTTTSTKITSTSTTTTLSPLTTTQEPTTTTTESPIHVFGFNVPKNDSLPTILRAKFALDFSIDYKATVQQKDGTNKTQMVTMPYSVVQVDDYDGETTSVYNTLHVKFQDANWTLVMNYTLANDMYHLDRVRFDYFVSEALFPNATKSALGKRSVDKSKLTDFSANKDNSYKCTSETSIKLSDAVKVKFSNYWVQPFSDGSKKDYDTAVECPSDITNTSKLVPIIVGSSLAVLVVLVLVAYLIGKRKHRPGYQQV